MGRVCVVVLGDIGRSPRMQYHAISLAEFGHSVDIIGYDGTKVLDSIANNDRIQIHCLPPVINLPILQIRLLNYVWKTFWQFFTLCFAMIKLGDCFDKVLVQNPPAIPTLIVCWLYCFTYCKTLIVDWHNYAYTLMGERCSIYEPPKQFIVRLAKTIEFFFARRADVHFCVSSAMCTHLLRSHGIRSTVLYDRPHEIFQAISAKEKQQFLKKLFENDTVFKSITQPGFDQNCPLIVSSTSWTEDEDFKMLFNALKFYEKKAANNPKLPNIICAVTGKGPMKNYYKALIEKQTCWQKVQIVLPWLSSKQYAKLLASANIGVCLHTSSSGLDLPMKVLDMHGSGTPVFAYHYECLSNELIENNKTGYTFTDENDLVKILTEWFWNYPNNEKMLKLEQDFKTNLAQRYQKRWHSNWMDRVGRFFMPENCANNNNNNEGQSNPDTNTTSSN